MDEPVLRTKGVLYLVATPIGNLGDISRRVSETLAACDVVAAEDTRVTRGLLSHLGISKPLVSCHAHNEQGRSAELIALLDQGRTVAYVSDAGSPGVSDPGGILVEQAAEAGHGVVAIPGPSAVLAALACSGLPATPFYFAGFLPSRSKERKAGLAALLELPATMVFFEAPHRIEACLQDMLEVLGDRRAALCRELTKKHEEVLRSSLSGLLQKRGDPRGEHTLVVAGASGAAMKGPSFGLQDVADLLKEAQQQGLGPNQAVAHVARKTGISRAEVYRIAHGIPQHEGPAG
jgi:16S rRNA (cytidine1402-2'-O)-methyltransferase